MRLSIFLLSCLLAAPSMAQPTAREWNYGVVGWNLGNQLECPPTGVDNESTDFCNPDNALDAETAWGNPKVSQAMIDAVKAAGFNAVRIPVRWQCHITDASTMAVDASWMQRVKEVVDYCISSQLKVIINTHHEKWLESRPTYACQEENNRRLKQLWTQIAQAFAGYSYDLAFAGTNEVHIPDDWGAPSAENLAVQNSYNQAFVDAVRATGGFNSQRHLVVQTYTCNPQYGLQSGGFTVPTDLSDNGKKYLSVEIHYYNPWDYCGGTTYYYWGDAYKTYGTIPSDKEAKIRTDFNTYLNAWWNKGLGVIIGEWGVSDHWNSVGNKDRIHENMTYYAKTLSSEAYLDGIATFIWDNNAFGNGQEKFGIFNRHDDMALVADWIMDGIRTGTGVGIRSLKSEGRVPTYRKYLKNHRLYLERDGRVYTLQGYEY